LCELKHSREAVNAKQVSTASHALEERFGRTEKLTSGILFISMITAVSSLDSPAVRLMVDILLALRDESALKMSD
jgi:hypothetical protein